MYFQLAGTNVRILGSLHAFPHTSQPNSLPFWALAAEQWSHGIIIESDATAILPFFKRPGTDLKNLLPADIWNALVAIWPASGPLTPLDEVRPWAAALLYGVLSTNLSPGMEDHLRTAAKQHGKPLAFLEAPEDLVAAFESAPTDDVVLSIRKSLNNNFQKEMEEMFIHWTDGNLDGLYKQVLKNPAFSVDSMRQAILIKRNRAWAPVIHRMLKSQSRILIAVGAMHLCGPDNLLDCLSLPYESLL